MLERSLHSGDLLMDKLCYNNVSSYAVESHSLRTRSDLKFLAVEDLAGKCNASCQERCGLDANCCALVSHYLKLRVGTFENSYMYRSYARLDRNIDEVMISAAIGITIESLLSHTNPLCA